MTPKERAADLRLQRIYGITLEQFNEMFIEQGGVCAICKRPPHKTRLNVDHDHRFDRVKIEVFKAPIAFRWTARATDPHGNTYSLVELSRAQARKEMRLVLRRRSIRGLLCMSCNKGLQFYRDIPERFDAAAVYLRRFNHHETPFSLSRTYTGPPLQHLTLHSNSDTISTSDKHSH